MLDILYEDAWRLGFKVSLAVVPYVKATRLRLIPRTARQTNRHHYILHNEELVDYLQEKIAKGQVDIVQHGYSHARENGKAEFASEDFRLVNERLRTGRRILNETFKQDVSVFVAPHERVSRASWRSLSQNRLHLCRRFTLGRFLATTFPHGLNFGKLAKMMIQLPSLFQSIPSSVVDVANILVIQWDAFLLGKNVKEQVKDAREAFLRRLSQKEVFVIAQHYWEYFYPGQSRKVRTDRLAHFNEFLNFVARDDSAWKTSLSELCSYIERGIPETSAITCTRPSFC